MFADRANGQYWRVLPSSSFKTCGISKIVVAVTVEYGACERLSGIHPAVGPFKWYRAP